MVKKWLISLFALILVVSGVQSTGYAYSYGDPNKEAVADAYELMVGALMKAPPNFSEAQAAFDPVKEELSMHMGDEPVAIVQKALDNQQKEETINLMQQVLVLNIARRFEGIHLDDYANAKLILAKGYATYKSLSPAVAHKDEELDKNIHDSFNQALQALGNPGLFGVGKKETNPALFDESKNFILTSLQNFFGMKSLEVGHFVEGAEGSAGGSAGHNTEQGSNTYIWIIVGVVVIFLATLFFWRRKKA